MPGSNRWKQPLKGDATPGSARWAAESDERARSCIATPKTVYACIAVLALAAISFFAWFAIGTQQLKQTLMLHEWERHDKITLSLKFNESTISYNASFTYQLFGTHEYNTNISTMEWRATSPNTIQVRENDLHNWRTITIKVTDDKDTLRMSPAITSTDSNELWFR